MPETDLERRLREEREVRDAPLTGRDVLVGLGTLVLIVIGLSIGGPQ